MVTEFEVDFKSKFSLLREGDVFQIRTGDSMFFVLDWYSDQYPKGYLSTHTTVVKLVYKKYSGWCLPKRHNLCRYKNEKRFNQNMEGLVYIMKDSSVELK